MPGHLEFSSLPPVPWVRERDIDLFLAELFATEPAFIPWLLGFGQGTADLPIGEPEHVHAVVNYARLSSSAAASGETDVLVTASYPTGSGELVLSIENKAWASPQPDQGERHRLFVDEQPARWGLAVLVAPRAWILSHKVEVDHYHLAVELEEVAAWCEAHAFPFKAAVFGQACAAPTVDFAPDLQDWHAAVDRLLAEHLGLRLEPQSYVRTRNAGQAKTNRWPSCAKDTLVRPHGAQQPRIVLKPASVKHTTRAALELPASPADITKAARSDASHHGFEVRTTGAGTLLVERPVPEASAWTQASSFDEQTPHLLAVGAAALQLQQWWNQMIRQLQPGR